MTLKFSFLLICFACLLSCSEKVVEPKYVYEKDTLYVVQNIDCVKFILTRGNYASSCTNIDFKIFSQGLLVDIISKNETDTLCLPSGSVILAKWNSTCSSSKMQLDTIVTENGIWNLGI